MSNNDKCYACLDTDGEFVRPCANPQCTATIHPTCLQQQYQSNKNCGICREPIITHQVKIRGQFNETKCCGACIKVLFLVIGTIGLFSLLIMMALGNTSMLWIRCNNTKFSTKQFYLCDDIGILTIFATLPFIAMILLSPRWLYQYYDCDNDACLNNSYSPCLVYVAKYVVAIMFIIGAHAIGTTLLKEYFQMHEFFTWRSYLAGFVVYCLILVIPLAGIICWRLWCCIRDSWFDYFIDTKVEYGMNINDDLEIMVGDE
jgi:hypothetical protein